MSERRNNYIDLKINGRLFPSWVMANFKDYKLPEIKRKDGEDPCNVKTSDNKSSLELKTYQKFLGKFMDYNSPYRDILMYHGVGAGKTASAINIYNMLYNYTPGWNVFILIKATLRDHPWMTDLEKFLKKDDKEHRFKNIIFISYDSPIADKQFMDAVKNTDISKKSLYLIDEAHNFIRNVYSNIKSRQGRRATTIYDYILNDKKENEGVRVILMSATPAINTPYELALMFNLLRPNIFPKSEVQFNQIYLSNTGFETLNSASKNMFQRRIMGLVSYYIGATPDLYASSTTHYIDVEMSDYQTDIYNHFEDIEEAMDRQRRKNKSSATTYMTYTSQACNFVFPQLSQNITGENRPRPNKYKINEKDGILVDEGKGKLTVDDDNKKANINKYLAELNSYVEAFEKYLHDFAESDEQKKYTLIHDIEKYHKKYKDNYNEFHKNEKEKSQLYNALYKSSAKMLYMCFNILKSAGPVLVYSNYVLIEGLQLFKIYLNSFGFSQYEDMSKGADGFRYTEYHGGIDDKQRSVNLETFKHIDNKYGKIAKIIMISPAGAEGISLNNVRQVHIMEPYWHEVRITQMNGRAIRHCSHKDLPLNERHVDIYRYKSVRNTSKITSDQFKENIARSKDGLIQSFCDAMKEVAVDCQLYKAHNMMRNEYKCFQFDEPSLFDEQVGPAYKDDIHDDIKTNNGLNSTNSSVMRIKVIKINAVIQLSDSDTDTVKYSEPERYLYDNKTGIIYDYDLHYAIGRVAYDDTIPRKINKNTYVIDKLIPVPHLQNLT